MPLNTVIYDPATGKWKKRQPVGPGTSGSSVSPSTDAPQIKPAASSVTTIGDDGKESLIRPAGDQNLLDFTASNAARNIQDTRGKYGIDDETANSIMSRATQQAEKAIRPRIQAATQEAINRGVYRGSALTNSYGDLESELGQTIAGVATDIGNESVKTAFQNRNTALQTGLNIGQAQAGVAQADRNQTETERANQAGEGLRGSEMLGGTWQIGPDGKQIWVPTFQAADAAANRKEDTRRFNVTTFGSGAAGPDGEPIAGAKSLAEKKTEADITAGAAASDIAARQVGVAEGQLAEAIRQGKAADYLKQAETAGLGLFMPDGTQIRLDSTGRRAYSILTGEALGYYDEKSGMLEYGDGSGRAVKVKMDTIGGRQVGVSEKGQASDAAIAAGKLSLDAAIASGKIPILIDGKPVYKDGVLQTTDTIDRDRLNADKAAKARELGIKESELTGQVVIYKKDGSVATTKDAAGNEVPMTLATLAKSQQDWYQSIEGRKQVVAESVLRGSIPFMDAKGNILTDRSGVPITNKTIDQQRLDADIIDAKKKYGLSEDQLRGKIALRDKNGDPILGPDGKPIMNDSIDQQRVNQAQEELYGGHTDPKDTNKWIPTLAKEKMTEEQSQNLKKLTADIRAQDASIQQNWANILGYTLEKPQYTASEFTKAFTDFNDTGKADLAYDFDGDGKITMEDFFIGGDSGAIVADNMSTKIPTATARKLDSDIKETANRFGLDEKKFNQEVSEFSSNFWTNQQKFLTENTGIVYGTNGQPMSKETNEDYGPPETITIQQTATDVGAITSVMATNGGKGIQKGDALYKNYLDVNSDGIIDTADISNLTEHISYNDSEVRRAAGLTDPKKYLSGIFLDARNAKNDPVVNTYITIQPKKKAVRELTSIEKQKLTQDQANWEKTFNENVSQWLEKLDTTYYNIQKADAATKWQVVGNLINGISQVASAKFGKG